MRYALLAILITAVAAFSGCDDDGSGPSNSLALLPLKTGSLWVYDAEDYDQDGSILGRQTDTIKAVNDTVFDSETYYFTNTKRLYGNWYSINRDDGLHFHLELDKESYLFFKYPATEGESYVHGSYTVLVESTAFEKTVEAGTFKCYKYVLTGNGTTVNELEFYFCPDVGIIAYEFEIGYYTGPLYNYIHSKLELKSYSLN